MLGSRGREEIAAPVGLERLDLEVLEEDADRARGSSLIPDGRRDHTVPRFIIVIKAVMPAGAVCSTVSTVILAPQAAC